MPATDVAQLLRYPDRQAPFIRAGARGGSRSTRAANLPDAGASEEIDFDQAGLCIRVSTPVAIRTGFLGWPETVAWLQPGLTPARRQVFDLADRALTGYRTLAARTKPNARREAFQAVADDLTRIIARTVETTVHQALRVHAPDGSASGTRPQMPDLDQAVVARVEEFLAALPHADAGRGQPVLVQDAPRGQLSFAAAGTDGVVPAADAELVQGLAGVLDTLSEHMPRTGPGTDSVGDPFADIKTAFAQLREALDLPAAASVQPAAAGAVTAGPGAQSLLNLSGALAEAHACAASYTGTPEWQRITKVTEAARALMTTIRETAADYWAEVSRDIRVRGFTRTVTARVARTVSTAADSLARRLEGTGRGHTPAWKAAHTLHRTATTCAASIMAYPGPGRPDRMSEVANIVTAIGRHGQRLDAPSHGLTSSEPSHRNRLTGNSFQLVRASFPGRIGRRLPAPRPNMARCRTETSRERQVHQSVGGRSS